MSKGIYASWAVEYFAAGMHPLPIWPGEKATYVKEWDKHVFDEVLLNSLVTRYPHHGIGLRMGSPTGLPGYVLACLDVDRNAYNNPAETLFGGVLCGKVGAKGITIFVQADEKLNNKNFAFSEERLKHLGKVAEFFVREKLTVIPPTIHPDTRKSYEWVGTPLLQMDLTKLPIIEA